MIHYADCYDSFPKKDEKKLKNRKNFLKKYWQTGTYMIYYMSARRKSGKNNGPWKLNNNKQEWIKFSLINFEHKVLK